MYSVCSFFLNKMQWIRAMSFFTSELVYALRNDMDEFAEILIPHVTVNDIVSMCSSALYNNNVTEAVECRDCLWSLTHSPTSSPLSWSLTSA